jgi:signal transduction histidine kinase
MLDIMDNGKGFDAEEVRSNPGLGIVSMEERTKQAGGKLTIDSVPGVGTRLSFQFSLKKP